MIEWHIRKEKYREAEEIRDEHTINHQYRPYRNAQIVENLN